MRIITLHQIDPTHLEEVLNCMKNLGSPKIHAVWVDAINSWVALEGTHRLHAAAILGLSVNIIDIEYSELPIRDLDWADLDNDYTVSEIVDDGASRYNNNLYVIIST